MRLDSREMIKLGRKIAKFTQRVFEPLGLPEAVGILFQPFEDSHGLGTATEPIMRQPPPRRTAVGRRDERLGVIKAFFVNKVKLRGFGKAVFLKKFCPPQVFVFLDWAVSDQIGLKRVGSARSLGG